jgi:hypothetical protein
VRIRSKKAERKDLENVQCGQKRSACKVGAKESVVAEEIKAIKKKSTTLHQDNRKDALRASQELVRSHPYQTQGYKCFNSFERLFLEKRVPAGYIAHTQLPNGSISLYSDSQRPLEPWFKQYPATAWEDGRSWHYSYDAGFAGMQNARVMEPCRLLPRFQRKI